MKRVSDVLDTWFDSGSMPYAQMHYPFENEKKFNENFPAEFIAEGVDQTRAWFYYLHAIANGIKNSHAFKNVIVNGIVLAEDGKKMSKKLNNYPDPMFVFDKYGADALRYYLLTSPVMIAENLNFSEKGVQESLRNVVMILWNVVKFYELFAPTPGPSPAPIVTGEGSPKSKNALDKWILARLNQLIKEVTDSMNSYNLPKATRPIEEFVTDLSTWYIRRSRDRFKGNDEADKKAALETTGYVLLQLSKVMAPFMPFKAESVWQKVTGNDFKNSDESVHLSGWPKTQITDKKVLEEMQKARELTEQILAARDERGFKVRQPIGEAIITFKLNNEYKKIVEDECNIKKIAEGKLDKLPKRGIWRKFGETLAINFEMTPELKMEGVKREIVRFINALRKQAGMTIKDRAVIYYETASKEIKEVFKKLGEEIMKDTLSDKINNKMDEAETKKEVKVNGEEVVLGIKKV
jgi:isoleucyl-tRNA synthetase